VSLDFLRPLTEFCLIKPTKAIPNADSAKAVMTAEQLDTDLPQDFETALAQLEELVAKMETGTLPLEESLAAYRRGVSLTRVCQERLAQAEQQISVLEAGLLRPFDAMDRSAE